MVMTPTPDKPTYEQFREEWLAEIEDANLSPLDKGLRFGAKLITQWLDVTTDDDDFDVCDGSGDGGIDIAYLRRADTDDLDDNSEEGDTYYLVQSKYGTAFSGVTTIRDEGGKIIDTLQRQNLRLSEDSKRVMQKIEAFRQQKSDNNRIVLVFATLEPISEQDRRALDDIKIVGRERISDNFDVEDISLVTIWEAMVKDMLKSLSVNISGQFVDQEAGLLVGMVSLVDLFKFLVEYKTKTGNLDQLYEKNVRQFLGSRRKVNRGIVNTLNKNPKLFGLYNNGITIVVSNYLKSPADDNTVEVHDPYVVNGCQTTRTIWQVLDGKLYPDGSARSDALNEWREHVGQGGVIAKIVKSGEADIVDITRFTNSQNAVRAQDFIALETGFSDFASGMANSHNIFLEIQRGGTEARKAQEKQHPELQPFDDYVNAFDLIKVYGAGWLAAPGLAFGKNAPFLPKGSIYERIMFPQDSEVRFGARDLYAAYKIKCAADAIGFGRVAGRQRPSRGSSRFLFYYVVIELLRDVIRRTRQVADVPENSLTDAVHKLASPESKDAFVSLCDAAVEAIDEYLTEGGENCAYDELSFHNNLNTFLKSEQLGRNDQFAPLLRSLLATHNTLFGRRVRDSISPREQVAQVINQN